jgi:hypothetical protein
LSPGWKRSCAAMVRRSVDSMVAESSLYGY